MLGIPSLLRAPSMVPFTDANVRGAAMEAMAQLRREGWWLVNADLTDVQKKDDEVCFDWIYRYRSGSGALPPRTLRLCIPTQS